MRLIGLSQADLNGRVGTVVSLNHARGQTLAFVLMANNYTAPDRNITQAMDRIVDALASGERPPADEE